MISSTKIWSEFARSKSVGRRRYGSIGAGRVSGPRDCANLLAPLRRLGNGRLRGSGPT